MEDLFKPFSLDSVKLANRFVFLPIKLGYGDPDGTVTNRQLLFYRRIAQDGPALVILEPVGVTPEGREHPRQLCIHLPGSVAQLKRIADVIHEEHRVACLHLNHAGAAANPKLIGGKPKAPSAVTCPTYRQEADPLSEEEVRTVVCGYEAAAEKAVAAGFDLIEVQAGHGYLISQFLNGKINRREDPYGRDRMLFAREVFAAVKAGAPGKPIIVTVSGNEMSPDFGISGEDLDPLLGRYKGWIRIGREILKKEPLCLTPRQRTNRRDAGGGIAALKHGAAHLRQVGFLDTPITLC